MSSSGPKDDDKNPPNGTGVVAAAIQGQPFPPLVARFLERQKPGGRKGEREGDQDEDWTTNLLPHLTLERASAASPGQPPTTVHRYVVQATHCNGFGTLHGGCTATLFDYCTTMPLLLVARPGYWMRLGVSRTLAVTYLRALKPGDEVLVESELVAVGRRLATLRGTMRRASDGAVVATCEHGKFNTDLDVAAKV